VGTAPHVEICLENPRDGRWPQRDNRRSIVSIGNKMSPRRAMRAVREQTMDHTPSGSRGARWRRVAVAMALAGAGWAAQAEGLVLRAPENTGLGQTPSEYALAHSHISANSIRVFGDYYLFDPAHSNLGPALGSLLGGFRVSTGVAGLRQPLSLFDGQLDAARNVPYVGLGYSHLWFTGALSVNADFGLASQNTLSSGLVRAQSLDDAARELRWGPVMAVNVKYSF
jgi:hypothetical protein